VVNATYRVDFYGTSLEGNRLGRNTLSEKVRKTENCLAHTGQPQSTVRKKMATGTFTYNALRTKTLKERVKTQLKIASHSNSTIAMLLV